MKIATILTCYNRKDKTLSCLSYLFHALEKFNLQAEDKLELTIYLTDDGCTDGTSEAVSDAFRQKDIHIQQGDGNLFWAGGMRLSWKEATKRHDEWDYYLLMNDDTVVNMKCFDELLKCHSYCLEHYHQEGIYSGITCSPDDPTVVTYGGDVILNKLTGKSKRLERSSQPQMVDRTNANILLIPKSVVDKIGIFYSEYQHSRADNDYTMLARRKGIPVLITAGACGECANDHGDSEMVKNKIINMTISERKAYFKHPLHSTSDYMLMIRRNMPLRYPISWVFSMMRMYCPKLYFKINGARGV